MTAPKDMPPRPGALGDCPECGCPPRVHDVHCSRLTTRPPLEIWLDQPGDLPDHKIEGLIRYALSLERALSASEEAWDRLTEDVGVAAAVNAEGFALDKSLGVEARHRYVLSAARDVARGKP